MDREWVRFHRARRGDDRSWRGLVEEYRPKLAAMVLLITGSRPATEDILQETFIKAMGAAIEHEAGSVRGFLGTIAYRLAVKEKRRALREVDYGDLNQEDASVNPLDSLLESERESFLADTIRSLSDDHRKVLVLRFYGEFSYDEIAELIEVPPGTVKSRVFYAVKTCRKILREKGMLE